MSAAVMKGARIRPASELYRALGIPDDRSARARAEERLSAVLSAHPSLAPDGWCDRPGTVADAIRFRDLPDVVFRPRLVEAFAWCRAFLTLGCRRVAFDDWNSTAANRMAFQAEMAGLAIYGRQLPIEQGVAIAAAFSLGIDVTRHDRGAGAQIAAQVVWEGRR